MPLHALPALIVAAAVAAQAPALKVTPTVAGPVSSFTLPNGLQVILKENHAAPVVSWSVTYKVGSRDEPHGATGSAHLLEHMLFKGTKTLGKGQVAQLLERNGASSNASTWIDWTAYYETYSSDRLELGLMVEAARMRDALILDKERRSEMTVVRNEMERGESNPGRILYQHLMSTAFRSHPYHHPTIGWRSDVEGMPTSALKAFYDAYYQPNNAVAVLVGDFKTAEARKLVERYFGGLKRGPNPPVMRTTEEPQTGERRFTLRRRGDTNMVQLGYHIPAVSHADIGTLLVLDSVLSSGVTSRLYQALVETELATSTYSDCGLTRDPGLFRMSATIANATDHAKAEAALIAQLTKLADEPVNAEELKKAKDQAEVSYVYANEGTAGLAHALGEYAAIDRWERNFTLLDDIKQVTAADVQRVARTYFSADNRTAGWYVSTADGPVPPKATNQSSGQAADNKTPVRPLALQAFEQRKPAGRKLTAPLRQVLPNGLTVLVLPNPASQTVSVAGHVWAGELHEGAQEGVSGAVASLLDAGTAKRTKLQLAGDLEARSASVGFSGGTALTDVTAGCLTKDLDVTLDALAETLMTPTFPDAELAKLKARWIAAIKRNEDSPGTHVARLFAQAVYPAGHPFYQYGAAHEVAAVEKLTRADLQAFHKRWYGPNTTTLVVVGQVDPQAVVRKLEARFAGWAPATLEKREVPTVAMNAPTTKTYAMADKTNVEIRRGHATNLRRSSPDYVPAQLANYVLGGDPLTARLGLRLRDELGLTYGTSSALGGGLSAGPFSTWLTVHPANMQQGLKELAAVTGGFLKGGVTAQELAFAKSAFIGSQAVGLATNGGMAGSLEDVDLYGLGLDWWSRYPGVIDRVTAAEVNAAAKKYMHPDKAHTIMVGPLP